MELPRKGLGVTVPPGFYYPVPGSFAGGPFLYFAFLWSIFLIGLLTLEWLWRTGWALWEDAQGVKHPATAIRLATFLLLLSVIMRIGPDIVLYASWADLSPEARFAISNFDKRLDTVSFVPFSLAWLASHLGAPIILYQLKREPLPLHLWPTWQQLKRPLKIGMGVAALAFALVYLR